MKVIGLTGGTGSGKSTVAQYLAELGAAVIDADKVGHEALEPGTPAFKEIIAAFGREIVSPAGEIDRRKLSGIVFGNSQALAKLNRIMHPKMRAMVADRIENYRRQGAAVVVLEAAVLLETGADWTSLVDEIWVTTSPEAAVLQRVKNQRGQTEEQILARLRTQLSDEERFERADVVIDNDGDIDELKLKVKKLWEKLKS